MYSVDFLPYFGAGQIKLDSSREDVRKILGTSFKKTFKKTKFSKNTTDDFSFCHVFYDEQDKVEAIEVFGDSEFLFKGKNLFLSQFSDLKTFLGDNAIGFAEDDSGLRSDDIGLSVYAPDKKHIETLLAYRRGYYG